MTGGGINKQSPLLSAGVRGHSYELTGKSASLSQVTMEQQTVRNKRPSMLYYTMIFLYKNLYRLGVRILRRKRWYSRAILEYQDNLWQYLLGGVYRAGQGIGRASRSMTLRVKTPFMRIGDTYRRQQPVIDRCKADGEAVLPAYLPVAEVVGRLVLKAVTTVINYTVPVLAALFLFQTIDARLAEPYGLLLEFNGREIGYITNEKSFDSATQMVLDRMTDDSAGAVLTGELPNFQLKKLSPVDGIIADDDLPDLLIQASGSDVEEAYGFYVSNQFVGAVTDKDLILDELERIKVTNTTGKPNERVDFVKSIRLKPGLYPVSSIIPSEQAVSRISGNETETETYTVMEGDTPTGIADKLRIPYSQLKAMNRNIEDELKVGMELLTTVARPFLSVKTTFTDVYEEEIPFEVEETKNATFAKSYRNVEQEGANGVQRVTAEITTVNGQEIAREIVDKAVIREPIPEKVTVGTTVDIPASNAQSSSGASGGTQSSTKTQTNMAPSTAGAKTSGFAWPTTGGRATTYAGHSGNGVDIAIGHGVPIYASRSGTVTKVVNGYTGYGKYIVINHGDGYETLYAHNSDMYVKVGDQVGQGQVIAAMGRTGWATGNHVHFEVRLNGRYMNPYNYIGSSAG